MGCVLGHRGCLKWAGCVSRARRQPSAFSGRGNGQISVQPKIIESAPATLAFAISATSALCDGSRTLPAEGDVQILAHDQLPIPRYSAVLEPRQKIRPPKFMTIGAILM